MDETPRWPGKQVADTLVELLRALPGDMRFDNGKQVLNVREWLILATREHITEQDVDDDRSYYCAELVEGRAEIARCLDPQRTVLLREAAA